MIPEHLQEQASLHALGALTDTERAAFEAELRTNAGLRELVRELQQTTGLLAAALPVLMPPPGLKAAILQRIGSAPPVALPAPTTAAPGLHFVREGDAAGWKELPVPGAWIKLLSIEPTRGYAVLLGRLDPGVRYPAHVNAGPEDFVVLTGDLQVSDRRLGPGDFHHADAGSHHGENFSVDGCTLLAVLTTDDPLVAFAMA
jgi:anti-sigma factor ChrR (cupin superfamily)